jgi:hypothetical protein
VDIQHWERILGSIDGFHRVRRLSVDSPAPVAQRNNPQYCADTRSPTFFQTGFIAEDEWMDRGSRYSDLHSSRDRTVIDGVPKDSKITTPAELNAWRPFCGFFQKLRGLRDLFWTNSSQFPPCLLEVLHRDLPSCRLHIRGFKIHSLCSSSYPREPLAISTHELALATSPSFTSIACTIPDNGYEQLHNLSAIMQMAAGATPNLLDIHMKEDATDKVYLHRISAPVQDLFVGYPKMASSLRSLSLNDPHSFEIRNWDRHIAFSNLVMLRVIIDWSSDALAKVAEYRFAVYNPSSYV